MLLGLAVGLAGYALFSLLDTVLHHNDESPWAKRWGDRALSLFGVVLYGGFCAWTVLTALTGAAGKGNAARSYAHKVALTGQVLRLPAGPELAGAAGLVLCGSGLFLRRRALVSSFADRFPPGRIGPRTWPVVGALGAVSYFFRGAAITAIGAVRCNRGRSASRSAAARRHPGDPGAGQRVVDGPLPGRLHDGSQVHHVPLAAPAD